MFSKRSVRKTSQHGLAGYRTDDSDPGRSSSHPCSAGTRRDTEPCGSRIRQADRSGVFSCKAVGGGTAQDRIAWSPACLDLSRESAGRSRDIRGTAGPEHAVPCPADDDRGGGTGCGAALRHRCRRHPPAGRRAEPRRPARAGGDRTGHGAWHDAGAAGGQPARPAARPGAVGEPAPRPVRPRPGRGGAASRQDRVRRGRSQRARGDGGGAAPFRSCRCGGRTVRPARPHRVTPTPARCGGGRSGLRAAPVAAL